MPNFLSGLTGGVLVAGNVYSFGKWKASIKCKLIPRNNFTSQGFQLLVKGFLDATLTISGPYDAGNMPITCGNAYLFTLQWTAAITFPVVAFVESLEPDDDAEDAPNVAITAKSSGLFTPSIT